MSATVQIAPGFATKNANIGDPIKLQIVIDEKIGAPEDKWTIKESNSRWLVSGNIVLDLNSLHVVASDPGITKFEIDGVLHSPGAAKINSFALMHESSQKNFSVAESSLSDFEVVASTSPPAQPEWLLPPVKFGGWNYFLIALLSLLLLSIISYGIYRILKKVPVGLRKRLNHKEKAIRALSLLQSYGRAGRSLKQEDWKKFSFELANILRKYSDTNFKFDSSDMTDREFLYELSQHTQAKPYVDVLKNTLSTIDEVRYGKKALDSSIVPSLILDSQKFIESTFDDPEKKEVKK